MSPADLSRQLEALPGALVRPVDYAAKGYDLDVRVSPEVLTTAVGLLDKAGYFLETITGVDWLGEQAALRTAALAARKAALEKTAAEKAAAEAAAPDIPAATAAATATVTAAATPVTTPATIPGDSSGDTSKDASGNTPQNAAANGAALAVADEEKEDELEVVYDFNRFEKRHRVTLRTRTPRSAPAVPTVQGIYPIAHWLEREAHDFFGIVFTGHDNLTPLLLPEDADFHPLLKDYGA